MDMTSFVPYLPIRTTEPHRLEHSIASDVLSVIDVLLEYIQKGKWINTMHFEDLYRTERLTYGDIENYVYP
jgi:hypothetical protein